DRDTVVSLLENDVDVNAQTFEGWTPLHYAAMGGYGAEGLMRGVTEFRPVLGESELELCRLLLENGVKTDIADKTGRTAREYADKLGFTRVVELIDDWVWSKPKPELA